MQISSKFHLLKNVPVLCFHSYSISRPLRRFCLEIPPERGDDRERRDSPRRPRSQRSRRAAFPRHGPPPRAEAVPACTFAVPSRRKFRGQSRRRYGRRRWPIPSRSSVCSSPARSYRLELDFRSRYRHPWRFDASLSLGSTRHAFQGTRRPFFCYHRSPVTANRTEIDCKWKYRSNEINATRNRIIWYFK